MNIYSYKFKTYRYGFNGKENDPEGMGGGGTTYDYGFRIYNPQIGKFLSVDPLSASYPWNSTYAFAENRVIDGVDLEGGEWKSAHKVSVLRITYSKYKSDKRYLQDVCID
jgi:RHS repeat-associated protein